jgi:hypothetical protein
VSDPKGDIVAIERIERLGGKQSEIETSRHEVRVTKI